MGRASAQPGDRSTIVDGILCQLASIADEAYWWAQGRLDGHLAIVPGREGDFRHPFADQANRQPASRHDAELARQLDSFGELVTGFG